jgi:hypothetical protein
MVANATLHRNGVALILGPPGISFAVKKFGFEQYLAYFGKRAPLNLVRAPMSETTRPTYIGTVGDFDGTPAVLLENETLRLSKMAITVGHFHLNARGVTNVLPR